MPLPLRQAAIVAYHGGAPQPLAALLRAVQALVAGELGAGFRPRPLAAVHATLVGLERTEHGEPVNLNRHALTESDDAMDLAGLFGHLCSLLGSGGLAAADLSLVAYTDVALPEETTLALPLCGGEREALAFFANATRPPQQPAR